MKCNFVIHETFPLTLTVYKYNELQLFGVIKKLSCQASCKTPFFHSDIYQQHIFIMNTRKPNKDN